MVCVQRGGCVKFVAAKTIALRHFKDQQIYYGTHFHGLHYNLCYWMHTVPPPPKYLNETQLLFKNHTMCVSSVSGQLQLLINSYYYGNYIIISICALHFPLTSLFTIPIATNQVCVCIPVSQDNTSCI